MRKLIALLAMSALCLTLSTPLRADDPIGATQQVIADQISAFLRGDAEAAYAFAAPGIKARYPDKNIFFTMVKKSYGPVYHPGNYAFGRSRSSADGAAVLQELTISGQDGRNWKAVYRLARQADGSYKIEAVMIVADTVSKGI